MSRDTISAAVTPAEAIEAFTQAGWDGDLAKATAMLREGQVGVNAKNKHGETALMASAQGHLELVRFLVENGADVNLPLDQRNVGWTSLHSAAQKGHHEVCRLLIAKGANVDATDKDQETPLHLAAFEGHVDVCRELIKAGADVEANDKCNRTPLLSAASDGQAAVCEYLVKEAKVNVNAITDDRQSSLYICSGKGRTDVVKVLLEHGAAVDLADDCGRTPLMTASFRGHENVCSELLAKKARTGRKGRTGLIALHKAAAGGHSNICKLLLDHGTEEDLFTLSSARDRPLDCARRIAKSAATYLFLLDRMVLVRGRAEADREAQNEVSRDFFSSALQSFLAPSYDPLPVHRSLIQWLRFSPAAARMQEEWPPTAHNWQDLDTKAKRLVAYREDAWERRKHLIFARDYDLDGLDRPAKTRLPDDGDDDDDGHENASEGSGEGGP